MAAGIGQLMNSPGGLWLRAEPHLDYYVLWPGPKLFHLPVETQAHSEKESKTTHMNWKKKLSGRDLEQTYILWLLC